MDTLSIIVVGVGLFVAFCCLLGMLWCAWAIRCNERTYQQRMGLLRAAFSEPKDERLAEAFERVTYERHAKACEFLRDPLALYDDSLVSRYIARGAR